MIQLNDLSYSYPGAERPALAEVSLRIEEGEFVGIVGANGSGKSTLCYALAGFLPSLFQGECHGQIQVAGLDPTRTGPAALAGTVGFVFQDPFSQITGARFSLEEEVAFGLENIGLPREQMAGRVREALQLVGLGDLADRSPFELSGGEQQRLGLASILALQPQILLLDEPTSQLDPTGARQVIEIVDALTADRRTTVLLIEQRLEWMAAHADRAIVLDEGRVVADGPARKVLTDQSLDRLGVRRTRYTLAAEAAIARHLISQPDLLPATLEQAAEFFV